MPPSNTPQPVAVIIGGARGIGLATATELAEQGWQVQLADRDPPAEGDTTLPCHSVDIGNSDSVNQLATTLADAHGRVDALVNAAGFNRHGAVVELEDETWNSLFDIHLGGVLRACRAFHPMLAQSRGAVVNFSSIGARLGRPRRAPYAAAKAGIEAMTRTLCVEWAADGIRVNAVVPGIINTRMVQENIAAGRVDPDSLTRGIPLRRFGEAREVAAAVAFLASQRASYITGQTLVVDGGVLANGDW